jgi:type I site-specific restriction-modification system R (restriction) subunit
VVRGAWLRLGSRAGPAPGEPAAERDSFADVVLAGRLRGIIRRLNPNIPAETQDEALRKVLRPQSPSLVGNNRAFHEMLCDGVPVEYRGSDDASGLLKSWPNTIFLSEGNTKFSGF